MKGILKRFLSLFGFLLILSAVLFFALGSFSDTADGKLYMFKFGIKETNGEVISNADIEMGHWLGDHYVTGLPPVVAKNGDTYLITHGYHRLRPAYSFSPVWPSAFSFSIEKEGFEKLHMKFALEELEDKYLVEPDDDRMVFRLPDFVLERAKATFGDETPPPRD